MKVTISVSKQTFELSERLAKQLGDSGSKVFAMGVEKLNKKLSEQCDREEVVEKLNKFYHDNPAETDPVIRRMATRSLEWNEW